MATKLTLGGYSNSLSDDDIEVDNKLEQTLTWYYCSREWGQ